MNKPLIDCFCFFLTGTGTGIGDSVNAKLFSSTSGVFFFRPLVDFFFSTGSFFFDFSFAGAFFRFEAFSVALLDDDLPDSAVSVLTRSMTTLGKPLVIFFEVVFFRFGGDRTSSSGGGVAFRFPLFVVVFFLVTFVVELVLARRGFFGFAGV